MAADRDTDLPEPSPVKQQPASSAERLYTEPLDSRPGPSAESAELEALHKRSVDYLSICTLHLLLVKCTYTRTHTETDGLHPQPAVLIERDEM